MNPVDNEVLTELRSCPAGLGRKELFTLCDSAVSEHNVSDAIKRLKDKGLVKVVAEKTGKYGAVYALVDDAPVLSEAEMFLRAAPVLPKVEDALDDHDQEAGAVDHFDTIIKSLVAIKKLVNPPPRVVDDLDVKLKCLNKLAHLFNQDVADILYSVIEDLESA